MTKSAWCYTLLLGGIAILGRVLLFPILPHPTPQVHDEFSYLLAANTFASGKLSSDPHPHFRFFETFHVLSRPRYMSKYPPGQAIVLAIGIALGHPHNGVILSFGLFVITTVWMLRSIVPLNWALFGGVWALLTFNVHSYWLESYWGGFVAAIGGNLVLGSLLYGFHHHRRAMRWWFVAGTLILAVTRPFEGLALETATIAAFLIWRRFANRSDFEKTVRQWFAPAFVSVIVVAATLGAYNWLTLGSPSHMPYAEYEKQYGVVPVFWPLPLREELRFDDPTVERFYREWSIDVYHQTRDHHALLLLPFQLLRIVLVGVLSVFGLSSTMIFAAIFCRRNTMIRVLGAALVGTSLFITLEVWIYPHYLAPLVSLLIALGVVSLHQIWAEIAAAQRVPYVLWITVMLAMGSPVYHSVRFVLEASREGTAHGTPPFEIRYRDDSREEIQRTLEKMGGRHVVFIRYSSSHNMHDEWVYNSPDIDKQPVIWARDRGEENVELQTYYAGRTFWVIEPDMPSPERQLMLVAASTQ